MRIAIPSDDQSSISAHTGRCNGFLIYTLENQQAKPEGYRQNSAGHDHRQAEGLPQGNHHNHSHTGMVELLRDCACVIAGGMGPRLVTDLEANGIQVVFTSETDAAKAADALAHGQLNTNQAPSCHCHH